MSHCQQVCKWIVYFVLRTITYQTNNKYWRNRLLAGQPWPSTSCVRCSNEVIKTSWSLGVPQGSILGPVLFLIYINDISNSTSLNLLSFADDTTIYHSDCDIDNLTLTLNHELKNIYNWLCANKLCLNVKKTQYCIFSPKNSNYEVKGSVKINNEVINQIGKYNKDESVKFLGISIDKHLTWKEHINIISSKISRAIFEINRVKHILPHKSLKSLYYTLIHSHI